MATVPLSIPEAFSIGGETVTQGKLLLQREYTTPHPGMQTGPSPAAATNEEQKDGKESALCEFTALLSLAVSYPRHEGAATDPAANATHPVQPRDRGKTTAPKQALLR